MSVPRLPGVLDRIPRPHLVAAGFLLAALLYPVFNPWNPHPSNPPNPRTRRTYWNVPTTGA